MMEDSVIALLNDIGSSGLKDEMFLDSSGEPTDLFLQALKSEFPRQGYGEAGSRRRVTERDASLYLDSEDDYSHHHRSGNRTTRASKADAVPVRQSSSRPSSSASVTSSKSVSTKGTASRKVRVPSVNDKPKKKRVTGNNNRVRSPPRGPTPSAVPERLVVNRKPSIEVRQSKAAQVRINAGFKHAQNAHRESVERSTGRGVAFTARQGAAKDHVRDRSTSPKRTRNTQEAATALLMTTKSIRRDDGDSVECTEEEYAAEIAAEAKYRTQQLRLAGQVQAIRALETQLADTLALLEERNKQVAHADLRVKAMHKELQRETRRASERVQENAKILESRRGDLLEKFKAQNDLLQAQLAEEQAKHRRANDRVRVLKDFGDKCKEKITGLEARHVDMSKHLADANKSLHRYRYDNKEIAADAAAQRNIAAEREEEVVRLRAHAESVDYSNRNLTLDNDRLVEEVRMQRKDIFAYQEQLKQWKLEAEIHKQRNATRQTEDAINSIRNRDRSLDQQEHRSNHYAHTHHNPREGKKEEEGEEEGVGGGAGGEADDAVQQRHAHRDWDQEAPAHHHRKRESKSPPRDEAAPAAPAQQNRHQNRVVKARYTLPKRSPAEGEPLVQQQHAGLGARTSVTAMSRRAHQRRDEDAEADAEARSAVAMPPAPPVAQGAVDLRSSWSTDRSATDLDNILGIESDEEEEEDNDIASRQRQSSLRQMSEGIQAKAKANAKAAEDSLRSSMESMGSELELTAGDTSNNDLSRLSQGSSIDVLQDRMNKLKKLQEKY
jgi:hypothetical protein